MKASDSVKKLIKRVLRKPLRWTISKINNCLEEEPIEPDFSRDVYVYPWLNHILTSALREGRGMRPDYTWGVLQGAHLGKVLGMKRVSVFEFGVAGGNGLVSLEKAAEVAQRALGIGVDVYGFDTGAGLPKPVDYRDLPNSYTESTFVMDIPKLKARLTRAQLVLGLIENTLPNFLASDSAPVAFVSIDVDYYSSTVQVLKLLEAECNRLLPRVYCYFDDVMGFTCSDFTGERLAIHEFNQQHAMRKISPCYGLKYFLPPPHNAAQWSETMYLAHIFDHPLSGQSDGLRRRTEELTQLRSN